MKAWRGYDFPDVGYRPPTMRDICEGAKKVVKGVASEPKIVTGATLAAFSCYAQVPFARESAILCFLARTYDWIRGDEHDRGLSEWFAIS